jgi:hypothetical protein
MIRSTMEGAGLGGAARVHFAPAGTAPITEVA